MGVSFRAQSVWNPIFGEDEVQIGYLEQAITVRHRGVGGGGLGGCRGLLSLLTYYLFLFTIHTSVANRRERLQRLFVGCLRFSLVG